MSTEEKEDILRQVFDGYLLKATIDNITDKQLKSRLQKDQKRMEYLERYEECQLLKDIISRFDRL